MTQFGGKTGLELREHGGNIDAARRRYGFTSTANTANMVDLSTGISPKSYPAAPIEACDLQALPHQSDLAACLAAARDHYMVPKAQGICAGPGTQNLLQLIPMMIPPAPVWVQTPTYNEHAPAWIAAGHQVRTDGALPDAARHAVMVVPNNPTGGADYPHVKLVAEEIANRGGILLLDGAFGTGLQDAGLLSLGAHVIHLRSFGKFFGMAGLRLGFAIGDPELTSHLENRAGPWAVSAPALKIATQALQDEAWITAHQDWLHAQSSRLVEMLTEGLGRHNITVMGGCLLFQTLSSAMLDNVEGPRRIAALHEHLAQNGLWTRVFGAYPDLLRIGIPGDESVWHRLQNALTSFTGET